MKKKRSHAAVVTAASLAAAAGASPIPFSDAIVIVPIQIAMLATISAVFGLPLTQAALTTTLSSAGGGLLATLSGQSIVSGVLKLVPGLGSAAGGAISAATAASITTIFGEGYIAALTLLFERNNGEPPTEQEVAEAFREKLHGKRG